jgi:hypothetical protein
VLYKNVLLLIFLETLISHTEEKKIPKNTLQTQSKVSVQIVEKLIFVQIIIMNMFSTCESAALVGNISASRQKKEIGLLSAAAEFLLHLESYPEEIGSHDADYAVLDAFYERNQYCNPFSCLSEEQLIRLNSWKDEKFRQMEEHGVSKNVLNTAQFLNWILNDSGVESDEKYQEIENMKAFHDNYYLDPSKPDHDAFPCDYFGDNVVPETDKHALKALALILPKSNEAYQKFFEATSALEMHLSQNNQLDAGWRVAIDIARNTAIARTQADLE